MMLEATAKFSNFSAPVLLVWGEEDKLFPVKLAEDLRTERPEACNLLGIYAALSEQPLAQVLDELQ